MPDIFIGSDHRGFELKKHLVAVLSGALPLEEQINAADAQGEAYQVVDLGPFTLNPDDDYNDAAIKVARAVHETKGAKGILVCGSAHGVAIQANRFTGVRAIAAYGEDLARIGREHNDANVLCLSADFTPDTAEIDKIVKIFFNTEFSGAERHIRRNQRLDEYGDRGGDDFDSENANADWQNAENDNRGDSQEEE